MMNAVLSAPPLNLHRVSVAISPVSHVLGKAARPVCLKHGGGWWGSSWAETNEEAEDFQCLASATEGVRLAARIVDTPCNEMNTDTFLEEIRSVGKELGITPTVIRDEELKTRGFGGGWGPALAVLSHTPDGATQTIAWVGKGIVYDTGGLSIKGKGGTAQGRSHGLQVPCTKEREPGAGGKPPGSVAVRLKSQKSLLWVAFEVRMSQDDAYLRKASLCPHRSASEPPAPPHTQHVRGLLGTGSSDGTRHRSEASSSALSTLVCGAAPEHQARAGLQRAKAGRGSEGTDM
ncbi:Putative aminopeptidase NPEPL1 [Pteropus alecto]|uniref:Putative aminopeptidase NPEPL1 n=1 Tax=Pteropus alecto TaxID=9402 RepID=L5JZ40_PTEAL|nr:Putative aminopeptidase NPEPL1 [Pteropus alecto]